MSEEVGTFSLKFSGNTYSSDESGNVTVQQNWEGAADSYGTVFGTLIFGPMSASEMNEGGPIKWVGQGFLEDGTVVVGLGEGTFESVPGQHIARTTTVPSSRNPWPTHLIGPPSFISDADMGPKIKVPKTVP
jgi:hypothetical protein